MIGSSIEVIMSRSQEVDMCIVCYDQKVCFQLSCCHQPLCDDCLEHINTQTCVYCRQTNTTDYNYVEDEDEDEDDEWFAIVAERQQERALDIHIEQAEAEAEQQQTDENSLYSCTFRTWLHNRNTYGRLLYTDTDSQIN